jgi:hypothetical protein
VPDRAEVCGEPVAFENTDKVPENGPVADGEKVTLMVQLAPDKSVAGSVPQVWLCTENSPVTVIEVIVRVPVPVFRNVNAWAALVVLTL